MAMVAPMTFLWWVLAAVAVGVVIWLGQQGVKRLRSRHAVAAARAVLRRQRPSGEDRWSNKDWMWAFRTVGTPAAIEHADICARLDRYRPGDPEPGGA